MSLKRHKLQRVKAREKRRFVSQLSFSSIRHFHISHNAPYLPPAPPHPQICVTFVFHSSWVLQPSQNKLKTMLWEMWKWRTEKKVTKEYNKKYKK